MCWCVHVNLCISARLWAILRPLCMHVCSWVKSKAYNGAGKHSPLVWTLVLMMHTDLRYNIYMFSGRIVADKMPCQHLISLVSLRGGISTGDGCSLFLLHSLWTPFSYGPATKVEIGEERTWCTRLGQLRWLQTILSDVRGGAKESIQPACAHYSDQS